MNHRQLVAALTLLSAPAASQSVVAHHESPADAFLYGEIAAFVGDMTGDGVEDYGVCADETDNSVFLYDGATSALRFVVAVVAPGNIVGHSFDGADFDGDGLADLAVGSYFGFDADLRSGIDGSLILSCNGPCRDVAVVGDVNGDAVPDVAGGNPDPAMFPQNGLRVYSGATGAVLHTSAGMHKAFAVIGPGDLDGDGVPDVVSSAPDFDTFGRVSAYSGASFATLWTASGTAAFSDPGRALATLGDVDVDGVPDLAASTIGTGLFAHDHVLVFSGADGTPLNAVVEVHTPGTWGAALAGPGDVDGDGRPELLISCHHGSPGHVDLVDALTDARLWTFDGGGGQLELGTSLDAGADLNGDGASEILVGQVDASEEFCSAFVLSSVPLPWEHLDSSLAGAAGAPLLRGDGALTALSSLELIVAQAAPSAPAALVVGLAPLLGALKGGVLVPAPDLLIALATDSEGKIVVSTTWPTGLPSGLTLWLQAWIADAGAVQGWAATNALLADAP